MMGDTAKPKPREHRCQWCPKLARTGTTKQCPQCKGWFCPPELRDCMEAHEVYRAKRKGNTDPQGFTGR